jgi:ribose/xylose/arabinose/galactoside ABC-type transport system permease subunit
LNAGGTFTISCGTSGMDLSFGVVDNALGAYVAAWVMPGGYEGSVEIADLPAGDYSILLGPNDWNLDWTCDSDLVDYWVQLD